MQQRERLRSLAQSHLVAQDAAAPGGVLPPHPEDAVPLVVAQVLVEARRQLGRFLFLSQL